MAAPLANEMLEKRIANTERGLDIHAHHIADSFHVDGLNWSHFEHAGIVEADIAAAELLQGGVSNVPGTAASRKSPGTRATGDLSCDAKA